MYCLQDVHSSNLLENNFKLEWGYECIFNSYTSESRGVLVLINKNVDHKILNIDKDTNGNFLIIDLQLSNISCTLVTLYGPNQDKPEFFKNLQNILLEKENTPLILCGDWNLVLNFQIDTY